MSLLDELTMKGKENKQNKQKKGGYTDNKPKKTDKQHKTDKDDKKDKRNKDDKDNIDDKVDKVDTYSISQFKEITKQETSNITTSDIFRLADLFFYREFVIYKHLIDSYDKFLDEDVKRYLEEGDHIFSETLEDDTLYRNKFKYTNIRYMSPVFNNKVDPLFPADARYKGLTYSVTLYADVTQILEKEKMNGLNIKEIKQCGKTEYNVQIGHIPLMLNSKYCNRTIHKEVEERECQYDPGGYFIVNGTEKVVISQDRIKENTPLVFIKKDSSSKNYVVQVKSRPYDPFKPEQTITIQLKKDGQMTIRIPIMKEIDVYVLFRALGVETDRDIINCITYDETNILLGNIIKAGLNKSTNKKGKINTREKAYDYLIDQLKVIPKTSNTSVENKMKQSRLNLINQLKKNFLPHVSGSLKNKAMFLGLMVNKLLRTYLGMLPLSDRDSYQNKRIDTVGALMLELFQTQMKKQSSEISKFFNPRNEDYNNPYIVISSIKPSTIEQGFKTALSLGTWIRKKGVAQMIQRLTYMHFISLLRRVDSPSGDKQNSKLTSPRFIHPTSTGLLCPVQTPEGANVGINKHLNLLASISVMNKDTFEIVRNFIKESKEVIMVSDVKYTDMKYMYKLFFNGDWVGMLESFGSESSLSLLKNKKPPVLTFYEKFQKKKRQRVFNPESVSIVMDTSELEIKIYCDSGRMYRPVLRVGYNNVINIKKEQIDKISLDSSSRDKITNWDSFMAEYPDAIEYIDMEEQPYLMIADKIDTVNKEHVKMYKSRNYIFNDDSDTNIINRYNQNHFIRYTHCELHPSLLVGEISVNIVFMDSNQAPRNIYQYSHARQAMGTYATNYRDRMDISHILYNPHKQVVTTRGSKYVNSHILPFGVNAIVAIASYTGFNQEDSLVLNETSLDRGLFRSTFIRKYASSISKNQNTSDDDKFAKPDPKKTARMKAGSYEKLNVLGFVPPETVIQNGDILFGKIKPIPQNINSNSEKEWTDDSEVYRMIPNGVVDRVHIGIYNPDSGEIRKASVRSERFINVGDKFSSMHGQKGTCGLQLPACSMPHTKNGIRPDIILNPNAIPSRMTIGQIIECLVGKNACLRRMQADGTPFEDRDIEDVKKQLEELGYNQNGVEEMYNGFTGRKMNIPIFIGPTYYCRLKHMVEDKIHGRARGPRTQLTHQALEGRSRDGGLRVGEMERDSLIAHGMTRFMKEKLMDSSDPYATHVCGQCGLFAQRNKKTTSGREPSYNDVYWCEKCNNFSDIHRVMIPYACKLLFQELMALCIAPRIRIDRPKHHPHYNDN